MPRCWECCQQSPTGRAIGDRWFCEKTFACKESARERSAELEARTAPASLGPATQPAPIAMESVKTSGTWTSPADWPLPAGEVKNMNCDCCGRSIYGEHTRVGAEVFCRADACTLLARSLMDKQAQGIVQKQAEAAEERRKNPTPEEKSLLGDPHSTLRGHEGLKPAELDPFRSRRVR